LRGARAVLIALLLTAAPATAEETHITAFEGAAKPAFTLPQLQGEARTLAAEQGRPVVVHFFATWCEPCLPELQSLHAMMDGRSDITVLALDVGEVDDRVKRFFKKYPMNFPILLDRDGKMAKSWGVVSLPATYILDGTLRPRCAADGPVDWTGDEAKRLVATLTTGG
jgi:peroxiredoxin